MFVVAPFTNFYIILTIFSYMLIFTSIINFNDIYLRELSIKTYIYIFFLTKQFNCTIHSFQIRIKKPLKVFVLIYFSIINCKSMNSVKTP